MVLVSSVGQLASWIDGFYRCSDKVMYFFLSCCCVLVPYLIYCTIQSAYFFPTSKFYRSDEPNLLVLFYKVLQRSLSGSLLGSGYGKQLGFFPRCV